MTLWFMKAPWFRCDALIDNLAPVDCARLQLMERIKECVWLAETMLSVIFLPLILTFTSILFLHLSNGLKTSSIRYAIGWFCCAWFLAIFSEIVSRYIVRVTIYLRLSPKQMPQSGKL